eukprot:gene9907-9973_t
MVHEYPSAWPVAQSGMSRSGTIVFVGRSDRSKRSVTFPRFAACLADQGYAIHWYEAPRLIESERLNQHLSRLMPAIAPSVERHHPLHRRTIRALIKGMLVLASPILRDFLRAALWAPADVAAFELDRFVKSLPDGPVHLIAHSAGAIAATRIWRNPRVCTITAFGYPFKHPGRPAEPYRTRHLGTVEKPLLIIQGASDTYGSDPDTLRALLPPGCRLISPGCDHEYARFDEADFARALAALEMHIGVGQTQGAGRAFCSKF